MYKFVCYAGKQPKLQLLDAEALQHYVECVCGNQVCRLLIQCI